MEYLSFALRLLLALVFLAATMGKLLAGQRGLRPFGRTLADAGVPPRLIGLAATGVVGAELAVAVLAPWPATGLAGSIAAVVLLAALTAGMTRAVRRGTTATCRCFGVQGGRLSGVHLARNALLTAVAAVAVVATALAHDVSIPPPTGVALSLAAAALGALVVVAWEDLAAVVVGLPAGQPASSRKE